MQALLGNQRKTTIVVVVVLLIVSLLIVGIIGLIVRSYIIAFIIFLLMLWKLLREIGIGIMYPGSIFLTRSDIQLRLGRQLSNRMVYCFNLLDYLKKAFIARKFDTSSQLHYNIQAYTVRHIHMVIEMLAQFQQTLSKRKKSILNHYRHINEVIKQNIEQQQGIIDVIKHTSRISKIKQQDVHLYIQKMQIIQQDIIHILQIVKSYSLPQGTFEQWKFKIFKQNLFQIRFSFNSWNSILDYQLKMVTTSQKQTIQTVVIYSEKTIDMPRQNKQCVLFCNPNGVFIQFFGIDSEYVRSYLRMGYTVIMWNYRGYGQSTGSPSIKTSQIDCRNVFRYYSQQGYQIRLVHGYSIGGAAAVGLFDNLSYQQLQKINGLIIDRSFSSIVQVSLSQKQMSIQFGPVLHNIAKILFCAQNIDLVQQFQKANCNKLIIWDKLDEVIPERASVKQAVLDRRQLNSPRRIYLADQGESQQLSEEVQPKIHRLKQTSLYFQPGCTM